MRIPTRPELVLTIFELNLTIFWRSIMIFAYHLPTISERNRATFTLKFKIFAGNRVIIVRNLTIF